MQNQRKELDEKIDEMMTKINSPITTMPGIGNYIGAVILAEIGDINNFETPAKLQAYAGADPAIYQSGTYTATNTAIVKRGFAYLRHALYLATCMASFADNSFARYAAKKGAREAPLRSDGACNEENDTHCFLRIKERKSLRRTDRLISE